MIPRVEYEFAQFRKDAQRYRADVLVVMLGSNQYYVKYPQYRFRPLTPLSRSVIIIHGF